MICVCVCVCGASVALVSALELLGPTTELVVLYNLFIVYQRNGLLLLWRIRQDDTSKWWLFWFVVCSWYTHLLSFFTIAICFKCQMTIERLMLSSWGTPRVVGRESALMTLFVGRCQLAMASHCTPHLRCSSFLCKTSLTTTSFYVH